MPYFDGGSKIHFLDLNKEQAADRTPVILLHGLGSRASDWQNQIDALLPTYRVIAPDLPGHGNSEPLKQPVTIQALADCIVALLDHLAITSAHVIGLSLGGMIAFQLAVDCPERIRSIVIINSAPGLGMEGNFKIKMRVMLRKLLLRIIPFDQLAKRIGRNIFPLESQQTLREQFQQSMNAVDKNTYRKIVTAIGNFNLEEEISGCAIPTLVLASELDYTSVAFKQVYVDRLANARLSVIPSSRHAAPIDSPDFCNREILDFLKQPSSEV